MSYLPPYLLEFLGFCYIAFFIWQFFGPLKYSDEPSAERRKKYNLAAFFSIAAFFALMFVLTLVAPGGQQ